MNTPLFDNLDGDVVSEHIKNAEPAQEVAGLMFIGDPHLESRQPGFRKDDFPRVALGKLKWSLDFAKRKRLQPVLLGDLFHYPQDNPNWLLSEIIELLDHPLPAIYGNHDVREDRLGPNDSLYVLAAGGHVRLLTSHPWSGVIDGHNVVLGGSSWGQSLPKSFDAESVDAELVVWVTHHDLMIPGYEEGGRLRPKALPGIDLVVNGHIHRRLPTLSRGTTHWMTPGNITRRTRSDASRLRRPALLCLTTSSGIPEHERKNEPISHVADETEQSFRFTTSGGVKWVARWQEIPHRPFDEVFHPEVEVDEENEVTGSAFIADLRELTARRTDSGAGLVQFLEQNLKNFEKPIADEIKQLAEEVLGERS